MGLYSHCKWSEFPVLPIVSYGKNHLGCTHGTPGAAGRAAGVAQGFAAAQLAGYQRTEVR